MFYATDCIKVKVRETVLYSVGKKRKKCRLKIIALSGSFDLCTGGLVMWYLILAHLHFPGLQKR